MKVPSHLLTAVEIAMGVSIANSPDYVNKIIGFLIILVGCFYAGIKDAEK